MVSYFMLFNPHHNSVGWKRLASFCKWSTWGWQGPSTQLPREEAQESRSDPGPPDVQVLRQSALLPSSKHAARAENPSEVLLWVAFRVLLKPYPAPESVPLLYSHTFLTTEDGDDSLSSRSPDVKPNDAWLFLKVNSDSPSKDRGY